jgi:hypothetical protein
MNTSYAGTSRNVNACCLRRHTVSINHPNSAPLVPTQSDVSFSGAMHGQTTRGGVISADVLEQALGGACSAPVAQVRAA